MNNSTNHLAQGNEEMELPFTLKVLFYIVVSIIAFASIIGNAVEITLFLRTQNLRTSTNYYITSMAFSDVLCVVSFWTVYSLSKLSVFGDVLTSFVCKLGAYFGYLSLSLSVLSLMLISVDRFVAIVFPMKVSMISRRVRSIFILLSWVFSLVFLILAWFEVRLAKETEKRRICSPRKFNTLYSAYTFVGLLGFYFLPLIVITILNICIINSLRKTNPVIQGNSLSSAIRHKRNQRIMKMLILIIVVFFLCYTPRIALPIWEFTSDLQLYKVHRQIFYIFAVFFLPFISTFLNPVIIFSLSTNYRQALKNYLRVVCGTCQSCFKSNQSALEENVELPEIRVQP